MSNLPIEELPPEIIESARKLEMFFKNRGARQWRLMGVQSRDNSESISMPYGLNINTQSLVMRFSQALADKLADAEKKYGYSDGWMRADWQRQCRIHLMDHIVKGDPRDVAVYCAFMWHHGWSTTQF